MSAAIIRAISPIGVKCKLSVCAIWYPTLGGIYGVYRVYIAWGGGKTSWYKNWGYKKPAGRLASQINQIFVENGRV